jgi:hypothetical protein
VFGYSFSSMARGKEIARVAGVVVSLAAVLVVSGCGSTKVVTADKTFTYQGSVYNVSQARQLTTRLEAETSAGETIDVGGYDRKQFEELLKQQSPVKVTSIIVMDDLRVAYEQKSIERGRDLDRMRDNLADAYKDLQRFMADPKKTQLALKGP